MPRHCSTVRVGGHAVILCGGTKYHACIVCGEIAGRLCDWKTDGKTCDRPLCDAHTYHPLGNKGKDLCPDHVRSWSRHPANKQTELAL